MSAEIARDALLKLLASAERARGRESMESLADPGEAQARKSISLRFTTASFPQYGKIEGYAEKAQCHANLELAASANAIAIDWDWRAGDKAHVNAIRLVDADALSAHLGKVPRWRLVESAAERLGPLEGEFPVVEQVLDAWRRGVQIRGTGPSDVEDWVDAATVLRHLSGYSGVDIFMRRLSIQLFSNSKRIEQLFPILDVLDAGEYGLPTREREEVAAKIGLIDFPREWAISGDVQITTQERSIQPGLPYGSCVAESISGFNGTEGVRIILSIENKTTFFEASKLRPIGSGLAIVYTAGMPSPSWRRAYKQLLDACPNAKLLHFGDMDAGGFRIADLIAAVAESAGRSLALHQMDGSDQDPSTLVASARKSLSDSEIAQVQKISAKRGWARESAWMTSHPSAFEQEFLNVELPI